MLQYSLIQHDSQEYLTVYVTGHLPMVADSSHPNFESLIAGARANDETIIDLFDVSAAAARKFDRISERVTVANGNVFFDGDLIDNSLSTQIVRFLEDGVDEWLPLVLFMEKVQQNPEQHSREQLYDWLNAHDFTITQDGDIVGYKGVSSRTRSDESTPESDKPYRSTSSGEAIVNGEVFKGYIPQDIGDEVEMPRGAVAFDPHASCSTGLHVGTHGYAKRYGDTLLEVHVNPRDVVSVPTDAGGNKVRVCRYTAVGVLDRSGEAYTVPVLDPVDFGLTDSREDAEELNEALDEIDHPVHPTTDEFDHMKARAKKRRRNFIKYATKHGPWTLTHATDWDNHLNWIVRD